MGSINHISRYAMPTMSGFDVLRTLRADMETSHSAIVVYTAEYSGSDLRRYQSASFDGWCGKPADPTHSVQLAERLLRIA